MTFQDYDNAVVIDYQQKAASGKLSMRLREFTPANVKKACRAFCEQRFEKRDEEMLSAFFCKAENQTGYLKAIGKCDINKFKSIMYYLEGRSQKTAEINIELLAWLIDFELRPYSKYQKCGKEIEVAPKRPADNTLPSATSTNRGYQRFASFRLTKKQLSIAAGILVLILGAYFLGGKQKTPIAANDTGSCMYWNEDHYEKASCESSIHSNTVVPYNEFLYKNFRQIEDLQSITKSSIGRVWYAKVNGQVEFYTGSGYHPEFKQIPLKPITKYIIDNYVAPLRSDGLPVISPQSASLASSRPAISAATTAFRQCAANTKAGRQCLRRATEGALCWQHDRMKR